LIVNFDGYISRITAALQKSENPKIIRDLCQFTGGNDYFESTLPFSSDYSWETFSDVWVEVVNKLYEDNSFNPSQELKEALASDGRLK